MHILHTVLYKFPGMLLRRICLTIKNFSIWWLFIFFLGVILWGQIRSWSLLGVKGLKHCFGFYCALCFSWLFSESFINSEFFQPFYFIFILMIVSSIQTEFIIWFIHLFDSLSCFRYLHLSSWDAWKLMLNYPCHLRKRFWFMHHWQRSSRHCTKHVWTRHSLTFLARRR